MYYLRKHQNFPVVIIWKDHPTDSNLVCLDTIIKGENFLRDVIDTYEKTNLNTELIASSENREELIGLVVMDEL